MKRRSWLDMGETVESTTDRPCDFPGCDNAGEFPAPKGPQSKNRLRPEEWLWFCLEHVRLYNASWDFCKGLSDVEIQRVRDASVTWERPTWPFTSGNRERGFKPDFEDPFNLFNGGADPFGSPPSTPVPESAYQKELRLALVLFNLEVSFDGDQLKAAYRTLAKLYHPDLHRTQGPLEQQEGAEKLKEINVAYRLLQEHLKR